MYNFTQKIETSDVETPKEHCPRLSPIQEEFNVQVLPVPPYSQFPFLVIMNDSLVSIANFSFPFFFFFTKLNPTDYEAKFPQVLQVR